MISLLAALILLQADAGTLADSGTDAGTIVIIAGIPTVSTAVSEGGRNDSGISDAGTLPKTLYGACVEAPPAVEVDGGIFLPTPRGARLACMLTTCEKQLGDTEKFKNTADIPLLATVGAVGLIVGFAIAAFIPWDSLGPKK